MSFFSRKKTRAIPTPLGTRLTRRWAAVTRWELGAKQDWDEIIAAGEAQLALLPAKDEAREFVTLPLATAYHQRASRSWAEGELLPALSDADRAIALDPLFLTYRGTRAVILDALGRRAEACAACEGVVLFTEAVERWTTASDAWRLSHIQGPELRAAQAQARAEARRALPELALHTDVDLDKLFLHDAWRLDTRGNGLARAHLTRGLIALREGELALAEQHLRRAAELQPEALQAYSLGAALYARGDVEGAAEAEARAVTMEPANARYRWALALSLKKLGREGEARAHAEEILRMAPEVAAMYRERIARAF